MIGGGGGDGGGVFIWYNNIMVTNVQNECGNDRRSMTISVALLGLTLGAVFFAYFTFSETNNANVIDATTMEFATIVSGNPIYFQEHSIHRVLSYVRIESNGVYLILFCMRRFLGMVNERQMASIQTIRTVISAGLVDLEL